MLLCALLPFVRAAEKLVCYVSVGGAGQIAIYDLEATSGRLSEASRVSVDGAPGRSPSILRAGISTRG